VPSVGEGQQAFLTAGRLEQRRHRLGAYSRH
jgi:hypothetical protein